MKGILVLFTLTTLFNFFGEVQSAFAFNSQATTSPSSGEMAITMTGMTSADTTVNFAFRTVGTTLWNNGVFCPTDFFAVSNLRKITATSSTAGKVTLAPFALGKDNTHEIVVVTAVSNTWGLTVTGTAYSLGTFPISPVKAMLNGMTYKNIQAFTFGSSKGFSKARKTSAGANNYGGIIATRIIGLNDTAPVNPVKCRLNLTAAGIIKSVYLGSTLIMADASLVDGAYKNFTSDDRYTFQRSEYQFLTIFGSIELDVTSTVLFDCTYLDGSVVTPPNLDFYGISAKVANATTSTVPKSITCPTGCTQCDKTTNCLQSDSCLFNPGTGTCITNGNCPADRPFALYNRTDIVPQCFKNLPNQLLLDKLIVSEKNITMGVGINPKFYSTVLTTNQFCFIYAEIGTFTSSSKFFFPLNYPEVFMPQMGATNSRIIYAFTNYIYNPTYPFAPKSVIALEMSPAVSNFSMVVRNLTSLPSNSLGWTAFENPSPSLLAGYEFQVPGQFNTVAGNYYMVEFFITYAKSDRIAIRIPATSIKLYINGNLTTLAFSGGAIGLNPNQCPVAGSCFIHIGFTSATNGLFKVDQALLPSNAGYTTPSWREIKQIVFKSDYYCPPGSFMGSSSINRCQCPTGYYPNTTTVKCTLCDDSCLTCFGGNSSTCTSCYYPFVLSNNQCVCPTGYVKSGKTCVAINNGTVLTPNYTGPGNLTVTDPNQGMTGNPNPTGDNGDDDDDEEPEEEETSTGGSTDTPSNNTGNGNSTNTTNPGTGGGNNTTDPGTGSGSGNNTTDPGTGGGNNTTEPGTGGNNTTDPGSGSNNNTNSTTDPGNGSSNNNTSNPGSGGNNTTDPGTGGNNTTDPGSGSNNNTNSTTDSGSGGNNTTDPGSGSNNNTNSTTDPGNGSSNNNTSNPGSGGNNTTDPGSGSNNNSTETGGGNETPTPGNNGTETGGGTETPGNGGETPSNNGTETGGGSQTPGNNGTETGGGSETPGNNDNGGDSGGSTTPPNNNGNTQNPGTSPALTVITSGDYKASWIKIVYLLFYGLSVATALLYINKYRKIKVKPTIVNRKEGKEAPIDSRTDLIEKKKTSLAQTFINYSTLLFLKNKKLHTKDKAIRVFHLAIALNVKLFVSPLLSAYIIEISSYIKPEQVSDKYIYLLGLELFLTSAFQICYSVLFYICSDSPMKFVAAIFLGSLGMVVGTERVGLDKLDNIAGMILICYFFVSSLIHYVWIELLLAAMTLYVPFVKQLRSLNVFKAPEKKKIAAISIASAPSLTNASHLASSVTSRDLSANGLTPHPRTPQPRHKLFKKLTLRDGIPDNIVTSGVFPSMSES